MSKGFCISLDGKVALVTGGSRGIGAEICRQLSKAGSKIIMNYYHSDIDRNAAVNLEQELLGYGTDVLRYEADISKEEEVKKMVEKSVEKFGQIDILVNNAAISTSARFEEMTYAIWKASMDVILNGSFFVTRHVIPYMLEKGGGSIIMISTNCTINGGGGGAHYPAAKAGIEGMAKQLVREYASRGIRTNIIQPAVIDTDMLRQRYPTDDDIQKYGKSLPVGRVGKPRDIADAVVFLVSEKAGYICGANLLVDGGRTYYK